MFEVSVSVGQPCEPKDPAVFHVFESGHLSEARCRRFGQTGHLPLTAQLRLQSWNRRAVTKSHGAAALISPAILTILFRWSLLSEHDGTEC